MFLKKLVILGVALLSASAFAATPISNLKLMSDANANGFRITGLIFPVLAGDAANKTYVDALSATILGAPLAQSNTTSSAQLRAALTDEVGTGAAYFVGGALGTPASVNLANGTGLPANGVTTGTFASARLGVGGLGAGARFLADDQTFKALTGLGDALVANPLSQFAPTTSAQLQSVLSDETGTGAAYFAGGALGTPASGTLTNATGLPLSTGITGFGTNWKAFLALTKPTTASGYGITNGATIDLWGGVNSVTPSFTTVTTPVLIYVGSVKDSYGGGSPEGTFTAGVGSTYRRTDGGPATSFYVKTSGTGNTGWTAPSVFSVTGSPNSGDLARFTGGLSIGPAQDGSGNLDISVPGNITFTPGSTFTTSINQVVFSDYTNTRHVQDVFSDITPGLTWNNGHPNAATYAVKDTQDAPAGEWFNSLHGGTLTSSAPKATDIVPNEFAVLGTADAPSITNTGMVDTIKLSTALTATRNYTIPDVDNYAAGSILRFYDSTGSPTSSLVARMVSSAAYGGGGNTFNGAPTLDLTEPYFNRVLVAAPATHNWTVSTFGGGGGAGLSVGPYITATDAPTIVLACDPTLTDQKFKVTIAANRYLSITGGQNGMTMKLRVIQGSGAPRTLTGPAGTNIRTPSGAGVFTTSATAGMADEFLGTFDGNNWNFGTLGLNLTAATAAAYSTSDQDNITSTGPTGANTFQLANIASQKFLAYLYVAPDTTTIGKIDVVMTKVVDGLGGSPGDVTLDVLADIDNGGGSHTPGAVISTAGSTVLAATVLTTESTITFAPLLSQVSGTIYWLKFSTNTAFNAANYYTMSQYTITSPGYATRWKASNGTTWNTGGTNTAALRFKTYK